jgi:uncharacterized repeat protein (TIGR01451 family)
MVRTGVGLVLAALAVSLFPAAPASAAINTAATALDLANAIAADPSVVTDATFVSVTALGTPNAVADSATPLASFPTNGDTYAIMTSGNAAFADDPNTSGSLTADNGGGSIRPGPPTGTDMDVTILRIDLDVPVGTNCLSVHFRFFSEEFPEFVGTSFNDAFIAELDTSDWMTAGSVITAPNNFAFDPNGDVISINSTGVANMTQANAEGTTYDGATALLQAQRPITSGSHSVYFSIFDQGDNSYDSAVFLDRLVLGTAGEGGCEPGAKLAPVTISKTADFAVSGPGEANGYTITIENPNSFDVDVSYITDMLPLGFFYMDGSSTLDGEPIDDPDPDLETGSITWPGPFTVPGGGSITLHFEVTVALIPGVYTNSVEGSASAGEDVVEVTPALDTAPITVESAPLAVTKTVDDSEVEPGATVTYTITVTNPNTVAVPVDSVSDTLPAGFIYVPGSTTGATTADPSIAGQVLTWTGPFEVPAVSSIVLNFQATASVTPGVYPNSADAVAEDGFSVTPSGPTAEVTVTEPLPCDNPTKVGTNANNKLIGTSAVDRIKGEGGKDVLDGRGADDELCGGLGNDRLFGRDGNDTILGDDGKDQLEGGLGHDILIGGLGPDVIKALDGTVDCIVADLTDAVTKDAFDLVQAVCPAFFWT